MLAERLKKELPMLNVLTDEMLSNYTYTKTGGPADVLAFPKNIEELQNCLNIASQENIDVTTLGNASNLIIREGGIRGLVLILTAMDQIAVKNGEIIADAGAGLIEVSNEALKHELTGLEFACGIPGSIGGALYMNAGAYGGEIQDVVTAATVITKDGKIKKLGQDELDFSYRHSVIQDTGDICVNVTFTLKPGNGTVIKAKMDELTDLRESKQPLDLPSCGSVFKRPPGHYTGKLIQDAGLQGKVWGGAQVSEKHAGFIVNIDHATATDYIELIEYIQKVIKEKYDVSLEREVRIIGHEKKEETPMNLKQMVGRRAAEYIEDGMTVGLGTGSTARYMVEALAERVKNEHLTITGVATSQATIDQALSLGIPLKDLDEVESIDLTIDGADEISANYQGIKGGGAALLFEKIVAINSKKNIWIVDSSKMVEKLGAFPLPVEVIPFGSEHLFRKMKDKGWHPQFRQQSNGRKLLTDGGHYIIDLHFESIEDPRALGAELDQMIGVVEHGLFLDIVDHIIIGHVDGVKEYIVEDK